MLLPRSATTLRSARRPRPALSHCLALVLAAAAVAGFVRGPLAPGASPRLIAEAISDAHGDGILADPAAAEQIVQAGGHVWISNPLDAFGRSDQRLDLDWLEGKPAGDAAAAHASVILVRSESLPAQRLLSRRVHLLARDHEELLFTEK